MAKRPTTGKTRAKKSKPKTTHAGQPRTPCTTKKAAKKAVKRAKKAETAQAEPEQHIPEETAPATEQGRKSAETQRSAPEKKKLFLEHLVTCGVIRYACLKAKIARNTYLSWYKKDTEFAAAFDEALEESTETLEAEAYRRAAIGTEKPVFQGGREVGRIREFSDVLLIFLLKARKRSIYQDNFKVEHTGEMTHVYERKGTAEIEEMLREIPKDLVPPNAVALPSQDGNGRANGTADD